jgi:hypothetical protein
VKECKKESCVSPHGALLTPTPVSLASFSIFLFRQALGISSTRCSDHGGCPGRRRSKVRCSISIPVPKDGGSTWQTESITIIFIRQLLVNPAVIRVARRRETEVDTHISQALLAFSVSVSITLLILVSFTRPQRLVFEVPHL